MKSAKKRHLLEEHYLDFFTLAMAMLRDVDDAKDAVQETMVKVLVRRNIDDVMSYTYTVLHNEAVNIIRRRNRVVRLPEGLTNDNADYEDRLQLLERLRDELPESLKKLVELYDDKEYSYADISLLTGLSISTVRRKVDKAHKILKKRFEEEI